MIDAIDHLILKELKRDSRLSFAEIGRLVNLSSSASRDRLLKMEDAGIIKKYSIELNQKLLGNDLEVIILVKVFHGKLVPFFKAVPLIPEIERAYRITGDQNVHLKLILKNQIHLQDIIDKIMVFGDTKTMLILSDVLDFNS